MQETEIKLKKNLKPKEVKIHFIGHLQKNKAKKAVLLYDCIQTVDSIKLAQKINIEAEKLNKKQDIFLQINIGNKKEKHGFFTAEAISSAAEIESYNFLNIQGIMIIPPLTKDKKKYLNYFKEAKKIQLKIQSKVPQCKSISMGMSGDYIEAIKEGATHIRIGTALFGERQQ